jgi:hypothetical protein
VANKNEICKKHKEIKIMKSHIYKLDNLIQKSNVIRVIGRDVNFLETKIHLQVFLDGNLKEADIEFFIDRYVNDTNNGKETSVFEFEVNAKDVQVIMLAEDDIDFGNISVASFPKKY